jgi:hypothetical protein
MTKGIDIKSKNSDLQIFVKDELKTYGWEDVVPVFFASWVSGVPSVLIGDPGASKTTFLQRFSLALKEKTETLDLKYLTPTRLLGIPNPDKLRQGILEYVGGLIATRPRIVILDELTRCNDGVQSLILEFIREGRLDQTYIACKRVCTANPPMSGLVQVSYLDYANATRMVHIEVPNLSKELFPTFVKEWGLKWEPTQEACELAKYVNGLELKLPDAEKLQMMTTTILGSLVDYNINGRQLSNLMRLLVATYTIEQSGLHTYTSDDIGRVAVSIVPLKLTKNKWTTQADVLASEVAKDLPLLPWQHKEKDNTSVIASRQVEEIKKTLAEKQPEELIEIIKSGDQLNSFIAFGELIKNMAVNSSWNIPFDNFDAILKAV